MSSMTLAMVLMLKDLASGPLGQFMGKLKQTSTQLMGIGLGARMLGQSAMRALSLPIQAFREAEDAGTRLKVSMMGATGEVSRHFGAVNKLATALGNKLPGTTADFQDMMTVLLQNGTSAEAILGGVGKAAGYLAIQLKMPFDDAAKFASKVGEAAGVAAGDMEKFMDVIQRTANLGVEAGEMQYAFGRSAGALKNVKIQGLESAEALSVLYAQLIKGGLSGETVGTNFAGILDGLKKFQYGIGDKAEGAKKSLKSLGIEMEFFDKAGKFIGVREMIGQLEKLKKLTPENQAKIMDKMFGGGQDGQMISTMISGGVKAYDDMQARMKTQADLNTKVEEQLKTLTNIWDSATGTFTNMLATLGASIAPELKALADGFGQLSQKLQEFAQSHPQLTKMIVGLTLLSAVGLMVGGSVLMGLGMIASGIGPASVGLSFLITRMYSVLSAGLKMSAGMRVWNASTGAWAVANATAAGGAIKQLPGLIRAKAVAVASATRSGIIALPGRMRSYASANTAAAGGALRSLPGLITAKAAAMGRGVVAAAAWTRANLLSVTGLRALAAAAGGRVVTAIRAVTLAIRGLGLAALANPIGIIAVVIVAAALLIYKFWGPISGFFKGLWRGLIVGLAPLKPAFMAAFSALGPIIKPNIAFLKAVWNALKSLLTPMADVGNNGQKMGLAFGMAIAGMIKQTAEFLGAVKDVAGQMVGVGKAIVQGLIDGVKSMGSMVSGAIGSVVQGGISAAKQALGMKSPSRVFRYIGQMTGAGLQLGILSQVGQVKKASQDLTKASVIKPAAIALPALKSAARGVLPMPPLRRPQGGLMGATGGGGSMQITFAPVIQLAPGSPYGPQVEQAMQLSFTEFSRLMDRYQRDKKRIGAEA